MNEKDDVFGKEYQQSLFKELRQICNNIPIPQSDWDLIWVLSGPQITFEEVPSISSNQTRNRLITGFSLSRQITALKLDKQYDELSIDEVKFFGPQIYFNGYNCSNISLRKTKSSGILEKDYDFPSQNLIIGPEEGITNTADQFTKFPLSYTDMSRKIVVVTDAYHLLRVRRYASTDCNPIPLDKLVYYPSLPISFPLATTAHEIKDKIPSYIEKAYIPEYSS